MKKNNNYCPYCMTPVQEGESCPVCGLTAGTYVPLPHHLRPGTMLADRYLVGRVLGEGGFGITYIGCDTKLEMKVAIKEYYPVDKANRNAQFTSELTSYSKGPAQEAFQRGKVKFLKEARTMAKMDKQKAIVCVRDFFEENNTAYIVMEYIEGTTFTDLVAQKGGKIPPQELFPLIEPLFKALSSLHAHGLIHRDISPDNLMLEDGEVRLIDFGCARESDSGNETLTITLKHGYAPIEQYQQKGQGPWTDVYALCATIYYCLVGKKPPQALDRIGGETALMLPSKLGVSLTAGQENALVKGLNLSPAKRFKSMEELHGALYPPIPEPYPEPDPPKPPVITDDEVEDIPEPTVTTTTHELPPPPPKPRRWLPWVAVSSVLLAMVILVGQQTIWKPKPDSQPPAPIDPLVFEDAYVLTEADRNVEALQRLMDDPNVKALVLPEGYCYIPYLDDGSLFTLVKPLQVAEGAGLGFQALCIDGGGYLEVLGFLGAECSDLRLKGDSLRLSFPESAEGRIPTGRNSVWMENENNIPKAEQAYLRASGAYLFTLKEDLDAAREVTTLEELIATLDQDIPGGVKITKDITFPADFIDVCFTCPVYICEGVTVTAPGDYNFALDGDYQSALINYGTFEGNLYMDRGAMVLNFGSLLLGTPIGEGLGFGIYASQGSQSVLLNAGYMQMGDTCRLWPDNFLLNTKTGIVDASVLGLIEAGMVNFGDLNVKGTHFNSLFLTTGSYLYNYTGNITVEKDATVFNNGIIRNEGNLDIQAWADFVNENMVINHFGSINADVDANLRGMNKPAQGVYYTTGGDVNLQCPNAPQVYQVTHFGEIEGLAADGAVPNTAEELRAMLDDSTVSAITLRGDISFDGDLKLTKDLYIFGNLTISGDLNALGGYVVVDQGGSFSAKNATLLDASVVQLEKGSFTLSDGGSLLLENSLILGSDNLMMNQSDSHLNIPGVHAELRNHSAIAATPYAGSSFLNADGSTIQLTGRSALIPGDTRLLVGVTMEAEDSLIAIGNRMHLKDCTIRLGWDGALADNGGSPTLERCTVEMKSGSNFWSDLSNLIFVNTTIRNEGILRIGSTDERAFQMRKSQIYNTGEFRLEGPTTFADSECIIENKGRMWYLEWLNLDLSHVTGNKPISG